MTILIIVSLVGLSGFLGARLHAAAGEIAALRANIATLKRRLGKT